MSQIWSNRIYRKRNLPAVRESLPLRLTFSVTLSSKMRIVMLITKTIAKEVKSITMMSLKMRIAIVTANPILPKKFKVPRRWGGSWKSSRTRPAGSPTSSWCSAVAPWDRNCHHAIIEWVKHKTVSNSLEFPVVVEHLPPGALFCVHSFFQQMNKWLRVVPPLPSMVWYLVSWVEKVWFVIWGDYSGLVW